LLNYRFPEYHWMSPPNETKFWYEEGRISSLSKSFFDNRTEEMEHLWNSQKLYVDKIYNTPFLNLKTKPDTDKIIEELLSVLDYIKFNDNRNKFKTSYRDWYHIGLYDVFDYALDSSINYKKISNNGDYISYNYEGKPIYKFTECGKMCPTLMDFIFSLTDEPGRIAFKAMREKGGRLKWHSHLNNNNKSPLEKYHEFPVHIPLITNDQVEFRVAKTTSLDAKDVNEYWSHKYKCGEVFCFNSGRLHTAFNNGNNLRWHVFFYVNFLGHENKIKFQETINEYSSITGF